MEFLCVHCLAMGHSSEVRKTWKLSGQLQGSASIPDLHQLIHEVVPKQMSSKGPGCPRWSSSEHLSCSSSKWHLSMLVQRGCNAIRAHSSLKPCSIAKPAKIPGTLMRLNIFLCSHCCATVSKLPVIMSVGTAGAGQSDTQWAFVVTATLMFG